MFFPGAISADSHVLEPPDCYAQFIDPAFRHLAPRLMRGPGGADVYVIPGMPRSVSIGLLDGAGMTAAERHRHVATAKFEETRRSAWDPRCRIADQERDGVAAEILYASIGMALCSHRDLIYKDACMKAYNRWLQGFCDAAPARLFGLGMSAVASVDSAIRDFAEAKRMGMVGIMMPGNPGHADYDHRDYDALWECAADLEFPLCFHILTSSELSGGNKPARGHPINSFLGIPRAVQDILGMLVLAGVFERHPRLKAVCAEGDAGWLPHYMQRMDQAAHNHADDGILPGLSKQPSEYLRSNVWLTIQDDWLAFKTRHLMSSSQLLWANDFPHVTSSWPRSQELLAQHVADVPQHELSAILRENAKALFRLPVA
jgi:predicted TIM-barrel fold metal-dependent hydrolase